MKARQQSLSAGSWFILSLLGFAVGGLNIHRATQYASAAPKERTTAANDVSMHLHYHTFFYFKISKYYTCSYSFTVDGVSYSGYSGHEDCPQPGADDSIKGKFSDIDRVLIIPNATVYYNPVNPSMNSLIEFSVTSKRYYQDAKLLIGIALLINLPLVFLAVLAVMKNKGNDGLFVDAKGTVIYPDEIDFGSEFGRIPNRSRHSEESYAASNDEAAKAASYAYSHGLRELYLDVIKQIHPDHASSEVDRALREQLTKEANAAFERGDDETLRRVLEEYMRQAPHL
jgi:hypothetical protein